MVRFIAAALLAYCGTRTEAQEFGYLLGQSQRAHRMQLFLLIRNLAPRHGFEPRFTAPKAAVLPLDDRGMSEDVRHPLVYNGLRPNYKIWLILLLFRLIDTGNHPHFPSGSITGMRPV